MRLLRSEVNTIAAIGVGVQLLTVVSGPLVARMLGPDGRGTLFLLMVVATVGAQIGSASLAVAISQAVARARGSARDVLGRDLRVWYLWSLVPAVGAGLAAVPLLYGSPLLPVLAFEAFLVTLFACWLNVLRAMLLGEGAIRRVNTQRIVFNTVYVTAIVVIFAVHPSDLAAVIVTPFLIAQLVALQMSRRGLQRPTGDSVVRVGRASVHQFARRTFISSIGTLDSLGLDALVLGIMLSRSQVGLYAVAASVTTLPVMALGGIAAALLPKMAAKAPGEAVRVMRRWVVGALLVDVVLVIGLQAVIAPAIRIFFGADFVPAITCARILILAWALLAFRLVLAAAAQAQGKGGRTSTIELVSSAILLIALGVGVQRGGIDGAAVGLVLTAAFSCASLLWLVSWRGEADAGQKKSAVQASPKRPQPRSTCR